MSITPLYFSFLLVLRFVVGDLNGALHHYEMLDHNDIRHRIVKRSIDERKIHERRLQFNTLGREFHLNLRLKEDLLAPDFRVVLIKEQDKEETPSFQPDNFYEGYIYDEPWTSEVHAYFDEDGTITATIKTHKDVYNVEPSWRHNLTGPDGNSPAMIAYKNSDLKMDSDLGSAYCGFVREGVDEASYHQNDQAPDNDKRVKRQTAEAQTSYQRSYSTPQKNTCPLLLVADYRFFASMGQNSVSRTTNYLIGLIDRVDAIYRSTNFSNGYTGMGFEIKEMRIHTTPTVVSSGRLHYNMEVASWETRELLEAFSMEVIHSQFCLSHLFTALRFPAGTLGLSYVASPIMYNPGGICSPGDLP